MISFAEAFYEKYPNNYNIVEMFEECMGCKAEWKSMTKPNLAAFVKFMSERLAKSSVKTYCAMMKAVLNLYNDEVHLSRGYEDVLSVRKDVSEQIYLSEDELKRIISYVPENDTEHLVKNQFIEGALTGARSSDYITFSRTNIVDDRLIYVSRKTHIRAEIPLSPVLLSIIKENEELGYVNNAVSKPTFNNTIREICRKCGITQIVKIYCRGKYTEGEKWRYVSSHTCRRSFATNLYLRGCDLYSISKLCGHSSVTMTETYIVCGLRDLPPAVTEFFSQFK